MRKNCGGGGRSLLTSTITITTKMMVIEYTNTANIAVGMIQKFFILFFVTSERQSDHTDYKKKIKQLFDFFCFIFLSPIRPR